MPYLRYGSGVAPSPAASTPRSNVELYRQYLNMDIVLLAVYHVLSLSFSSKTIARANADQISFTTPSSFSPLRASPYLCLIACRTSASVLHPPKAPLIVVRA